MVVGEVNAYLGVLITVNKETIGCTYRPTVLQRTDQQSADSVQTHFPTLRKTIWEIGG